MKNLYDLKKMDKITRFNTILFFLQTLPNELKPIFKKALHGHFEEEDVTYTELFNLAELAACGFISANQVNCLIEFSL